MKTTGIVHVVQNDGIDHVEQVDEWKISSQNDIWEAWRQYLDLCDHHEYCLEKHHVIKCGYSIKCDPFIPQELYEYVDISTHSITSPFKTCVNYTKFVLESMKNCDLVVLDDVEDAISVFKNHERNPSLIFCKDFFKLCLWLYKTPNLHSRLAMNEAGFNHSFVWPLMELAVDSFKDSNIKFICGEYILKSSKQEYKADACIVDQESELCFLETSGKFKHGESGKYGFDYIKITFGALCLFNAIYKKYCWATLKTAINLQIPFVHAIHDEVQLWVIQLCSPKLYTSNKIYKSTIAKELNHVTDIVAVGNLVWTLKSSLEKAVRVSRDMKAEHEEYLLNKMLYDDTDSREPLSRMVDLDIQKPEHGSGYGLLLPEEKGIEDATVTYKQTDECQ